MFSRDKYFVKRYINLGFFINLGSLSLSSTSELRCLLAGVGRERNLGGKSPPSKVRFNRSACQGPLLAIPTRISPRLFQLYFCQGAKLDFLLLFPRSRVSHCLGQFAGVSAQVEQSRHEILTKLHCCCLLPQLITNVIIDVVINRHHLHHYHHHHHHQMFSLLLNHDIPFQSL